MICDLAETYHIFDYKSVPCRLLGTLVAGLRDDSRIKQKMAGITSGPQTVLIASILDSINLLLWPRTEDGVNDTNRPKSVARCFMIEDAEPKAERLTPEEYRKIRESILKGAE